MKTIAIANQKGGTGKTTTAYNLGIALTQQGYRVLMVDFDPQGNLSCYCGIPPEQDLEQTITELLMKVAYEKPLSRRECVYQSRRTDDSAPQVDFIPSNLRLASFELAMGTMMCREVLLKTCLEQYSSQYDYCIIDNPPDIGLNVINALAITDEVIVPVKVDEDALEGLDIVTEQIEDAKVFNPALKLAGVLITSYQNTDGEAAGVEWLEQKTDFNILGIIRYSKKVAENTFMRKPIYEYSPCCGAAQGYKKFVTAYTGKAR
jgi:chromosome partitioning protein